MGTVLLLCFAGRPHTDLTVRLKKKAWGLEVQLWLMWVQVGITAIGC